jgi:hypothetical protein
MSLDEKMKYDKCNSDKFIPNYYANNPNAPKNSGAYVPNNNKKELNIVTYNRKKILQSIT